MIEITKQLVIFIMSISLFYVIGWIIAYRIIKITPKEIIY